MMVILKKMRIQKMSPPKLEEEIKNIVDTLKEVNLGIDEAMRLTYVSSSLDEDEIRKYINLIMKFRDVYAWSYKRIPGLDPRVAVHRLAVK